MFFLMMSLFSGCEKRPISSSDKTDNTEFSQQAGDFGFEGNSCQVYKRSDYDFRDVVFRLRGSEKDSVRKELEKELQERFLTYCKGECADPKVRQRFLGGIQTEIHTEGKKICMMGSLRWNVKNDPSGFKEKSQNLETAMQELARELIGQGIDGETLFIRSPTLLPSNCMTGRLGDKLKLNLEQQLQQYEIQLVSEISTGVMVLRLELYDESSSWRLKVINVTNSSILGSILVPKDLLPPNHFSQCSADDILGVDRPKQLHSSGLSVQIDAGNRTLCEGESYSIRFQANRDADFYLFSITNERFVKVWPKPGDRVSGKSSVLPTMAMKFGDGQSKLILLGVPKGQANVSVNSLPINCNLSNDFAKVLNNDYAYEVQSIEVNEEGQNGCPIQPLSNRTYRDLKRKVGTGFSDCTGP